MITTMVLEAVTPRQVAIIIIVALEEAREATEARTAVMALALNIGTRAHSAPRRGAKIEFAQ